MPNNISQESRNNAVLTLQQRNRALGSDAPLPEWRGAQEVSLITPEYSSLVSIYTTTTKSHRKNALRYATPSHPTHHLFERCLLERFCVSL